MSARANLVHIPLVRLVATGAVALAVGAIGWWPTARLAGSEGLIAMAVGIGASLTACWVGLVAEHVAVRCGWQPAVAWMLCTAVRFGFAVLAGVLLVVSHLLMPVPLLLWLAVGYLAIVGTEAAGQVLRRSALEAGI